MVPEWTSLQSTRRRPELSFAIAGDGFWLRRYRVGVQIGSHQPEGRTSRAAA